MCLGEGDWEENSALPFLTPLVSIDLLVRNSEGPFSSVSARIGLLWAIGSYQVAE